MDKRFENFTVTISKLNKLVQKIKLFEMENYGLTAVHVMCIYYLYERDGATASELVRLTLDDKAAISRALKLLKEKGLIVYSSAKYNAKISLTPEGVEVAKFIEERADAAVNAGGELLDKKQSEDFYVILGSICQSLEKYYYNLKNK